MKELNAEYEKLFKLVSKGQNLSKEENDIEHGISEIFKEIINQIIGFPNINIELIGNWVWVSGATYPIKEELKKAGFLFASQKKMWFWRPEEYKSTSKKEMSMEDIRKKYGSQKINYSDSNRYLSGIGSLKLTKAFKKLQKLLKQRASIHGIGSIKTNNFDDVIQ